MLRIRPVQLRVFAVLPRLQLERKLGEHLRRYFPHECERGRVDQFVHLGVERAEYHGYETERDQAMYVSLMAMLGCDFDRDPQIPWVGAELDLPVSSPSSDRLTRVYDSVVSYLEDIAGPNNGHLVRAGLRIRGLDPGDLRAPESDDYQTAVVEWLAQMYPEKARRQGADAMAALADAAVAGASARGATSYEPMAIHALHAFMIGSGYDRDPLYSWLNGVLDDPEIHTVEKRYQRLLRASAAYLDVTMRAPATTS